MQARHKLRLMKEGQVRLSLELDAAYCFARVNSLLLLLLLFSLSLSPLLLLLFLILPLRICGTGDLLKGPETNLHHCISPHRVTWTQLSSSLTHSVTLFFFSLLLFSLFLLPAPLVIGEMRNWGILSLHYATSVCPVKYYLGQSVPPTRHAQSPLLLCLTFH